MSISDPLSSSNILRIKTFLYDHKKEVMGIIAIISLLLVGLIIFIWWNNVSAKAPYYFSS